MSEPRDDTTTDCHHLDDCPERPATEFLGRFPRDGSGVHSPERGHLIEQACEVMHNAYEAAALGSGWETQERSRKPWVEVPEANKATMRSAVSALLDWLNKGDRFAGGARLTSLDPENKSGHYVGDGLCWCGDVHYYREVSTPPAHHHDPMCGCETPEGRDAWAVEVTTPPASEGGA